MAIRNKKKIVEDAKNETWTYHNLKNTKRTMNSDRSDHTHTHTKHTHKTQHMYYVTDIITGRNSFNPLNTELNPICQ